MSTLIRIFGFCSLITVAYTAATTCTPGFCQHGGNCYIDPATKNAKCNCAVGFAGTNCQDPDPCNPTPCANAGACVSANKGTTFTCTCQPGFTGNNCSTAIDQCAGNPCENGTCEDHGTKYVCKCFPGYSGVNCESYVGLCAKNPCSTKDTNAVCVQEKDKKSYRCDCSSHDYFGLNCEAPTKDCGRDEESYCICTVNNLPVRFPIPTPASYEGINWRDIVSGILGILLGWLLGTVLLHCCKCCFANPDKASKQQKPWTRPHSAQSNDTMTSGISSTSGASRNQIAPVETTKKDFTPMNVYRAAFGDELTHTISVKKSEETYISGRHDWK